MDWPLTVGIFILGLVIGFIIKSCIASKKDSLRENVIEETKKELNQHKQDTNDYLATQRDMLIGLNQQLNKVNMHWNQGCQQLVTEESKLCPLPDLSTQESEAISEKVIDDVVEVEETAEQDNTTPAAETETTAEETTEAKENNSDEATETVADEDKKEQPESEKAAEAETPEEAKPATEEKEELTLEEETDLKKPASSDDSAEADEKQGEEKIMHAVEFPENATVDAFAKELEEESKEEKPKK